MNRREFLTQTVFTPSKEASAGMEPYKGKWDTDHAAHLLRRTLFGAKPSEIKQIAAGTMSAAVDKLFTPPSLPNPVRPIKYLGDNSDYAGDPSDWTHLAYADATADLGWFTFLQTWHYKQMLEQPVSVNEKMILFWHNHFCTSYSTVKDARYMYKTHALIRENALGNFKTLAKRVTLDPGMLSYLNGNTNTRTGPNENYGRELLELFTVGKGPEIGAGNYTNYTEADIKAAAHVLSGWKDDPKVIDTVFSDTDHDSTDKKFSAAFGNTIIKGRTGKEGAEQELDDLITMIFNSPATAHYLSQKLYRWFVSPTITPDIEKRIITPMAAALRKNNYEIAPVLRQLFSSAHFYDPSVRGVMIKNPIDFSVGIMRSAPIDSCDRMGYFEDTFPSKKPQLSSDYGNIHYALRPFRAAVAGMQYDLQNPPSVAGLPAYYQMPQLHKLWINADTLQRRVKLVDDLLLHRFDYDMQSGFARMNVLGLAKETSDPTSASILQSELADLLFAVKVSPEHQSKAKALLLTGMSEEQWAEAWKDYLKNPDDLQKQERIDANLRSMLRYLMGLGEYQLM